MKLKTLFSWIMAPAVSTDPDTMRQVGLLNRLTLSAILGFAILLILAPPDGWLRPAVMGIDIAVAAALMGLQVALRSGRVRLVSGLTIALSFAWVVLVSVAQGTVLIPASTGYVFTIILVGSLYSRRWVAAAVLACSLAVLGLIAAESYGLLPPVIRSPSYVQWFTYTCLFAVVGSLASFANTSHRQALQRANDEIAQRQAAELELRQLSQSLEERVEARTADLTRLNHELAESEARFRALFQEAGDGVLIADSAGRLIDINPRGCGLLGAPREALLGQPLEVLLGLQSQNGETSGSGRPLADERRLRRADGTDLDAEVVVRDLRDGRTQAIVREIGERKRLEAALLASETRLRSLVDSVDDIVFTLDADGRHTGVFGRWLSRWGMDADAFIGRTAAEVLGDPAGRPHAAAVNRAAIGERVTYEWRLPVQDGERVIQTVLSPIRDGQSRVVGLVGVGRDITALRASEAEARRLSERLRHLRDIDRQILAADSQVLLARSALTALLAIVSCDQASVWVPGPDGDPLALAEHGQCPGLPGSLLEIPLHIQGELLGGLRLARVEPGGFDPESSLVAREAADHLAVALWQAALRDQLERRLQAMTAIHRAGQQLQALMTHPEALADEIFDTLHDLVEYQYGAVVLLDQASGRLQAFAISQPGLSQAEIRSQPGIWDELPAPLDVGVIGWVMKQGQTVRLDDAPADPRYFAAWPDVRSELCVPMRAGPNVIGVVNLEAVRPRAFSESDQRLLETMAAQIAIAIVNSRLYHQVVNANQRLRELSQSVLAVQEVERRRLAWELHDDATQSLTGLIMHLGALRGSLPAGTAAGESLQRAEAVAADVLTSLRRLISDLRPPALDDLGLAAALRGLTENLRAATGADVTFASAGDLNRLPAEVEITVYRIVQQALDNARQHAAASRVDVAVSAGPERLTLAVYDNGRGLDLALEAQAAGPRFGLTGMRERAELLGGTLDLASSPGAGLALCVSLPLERSKNDVRAGV